MPAFGARVSDADLEALVAYVHWVRRHPRTGRAPRAGRLSEPDQRAPEAPAD
jgi:hypothetical protein